MKLPKTDYQNWYQDALEKIESGMNYNDLRKEVNQMRVDELRSYGFIEKMPYEELGDSNKRQSDKFELTVSGTQYLAWLQDKTLFDTKKWGNGKLFTTYMEFYSRRGDLQALFPVVIQALQSDDFIQSEKIKIASICLITDNGYLHTIAKLYLAHGHECLNWIPKNSSSEPALTDKGKVKAVTIRFSQVGLDALQKVSERALERELRTGQGGHKGSDGFCAELALIIMASRLDESL